VRPTIASQEKPTEPSDVRFVEGSAKGRIGRKLEIAEGIFDVLSLDGPEFLLTLAIVGVFFLWWLLAPIARSILDWASGGN
jgi:hypothetical protein